jgi:hypothetical protein
VRRASWPALLHEHLNEAVTFEWGKSDCVLRCADWVTKATGEDYAQDYRGKYATEAEAQGLLADLGADGAADLADRHLQAIDVPFAQRGDVVLYAGALGICDGRYSHFLTPEGRTRIGTLKCRKAWKV